jgi:hypothetical protein
MFQMLPAFSNNTSHHAKVHVITATDPCGLDSLSVLPDVQNSVAEQSVL